MVKLSNVFQVKEIKVKTPVKGLEGIEVGDELEISIEVKHSGRGNRGNLQPRMKVRNETKETEYIYSVNQLARVLEKFTLKEANF